MKILKKTKVLLSATFIALNFRNDVFAYNNIDVAFAEFIKAVYSNTQTVSKADSLCVYGSDGVASILEAEGEKSIVILRDEQKSGAGCRIVYVAKSKSRYVRSFIDSFNGSGALTIATFSSFVNDGGMMSVEPGRRTFELTVNADALKKSSAKIDSAITGLIVDKR